MSSKKSSKSGIIMGAIVLLVVFGWRGYNIFKNYQEANAEDTFGITTLNSNLVSNFSEKTDKLLGNTLQGELSKDKDPNGKPYRLSALEVINPDGKTMRPANSFVEYVQKEEIRQIDEQIAKVKELNSTEDSKQIIEKSLIYFTEAKKIYQTELVKVAKMFDNKADKSVIKKFAKEESNKVQPILNAEREKLLEVAIPYAKKNGIEVFVNNFSGIKVLSVRGN